MFSHFAETNEIQSFIPACMKCISMLDIKTDGSLKAKRHILVITGYETNSSSKKRAKEEEQVYYSHVIV